MKKNKRRKKAPLRKKSLLAFTMHGLMGQKARRPSDTLFGPSFACSAEREGT